MVGERRCALGGGVAIEDVVGLVVGLGLVAFLGFVSL